MEKATMTVKEMATYIGCSTPTAYNITEREDFSGCLIRLGRKKLILKDSLAGWLAKQAASGARL